MDADKITAYGIAIASLIAAITSFFLRREKDTAADERADRKLVAGQTDKLFARLLARIESLEGRMTTLTEEHADCQAENAALHSKVEKLEGQNARQQARIEELEKQVGKISQAQ